MKIKSLFWSLLACTALVACSNNEIIDESGNKPGTGELESVPAYITISLGTANNSSRAAVNGDQDGDAEDSGHENAGTIEENKINDVAVIIKSLTPAGANASNSGIAQIITSEEFTKEKEAGEDIYTITTAFKVLAGTQKVLTIVNPTQAIKDAVTKAKTDGYVTIGNLYDALAKNNGLLSSYGLGYDNLGNCANAIMLVNRDEVTVDAKSTTSESSPAIAKVMLERPVAKIAYRGSGDTQNTFPITITVTKQEYNVVEVEDVTYALVKDAADRIRAAKASEIQKDAEGRVIDLKLVREDGTFQCYTYNNATKAVGKDLMNPIELKGEITSIPDNAYYLLKDNDEWVAPICVFTPYTEELGGEKGWNVQLSDYALINLASDSYVIRHTANELGADINTFGLLTGKNYIADPYFDDKNAASTTYNFAGYANWEEADWTNWNNKATKWFKNSLKNVADETANIWEGKTHFAPLPTTASTGDSHDNKTIGEHLQYCFESSVMSHNQLHGLTTGIVFKGVVKGAESLPTMYQYGTEVYNDLNEIFKAYASGNKSIKAIETAIKEASYSIESDDCKVALRAVGIKIYENGECYYYTNQIKHFDNGDNNIAGNMEFAIVRNNIYSLSVTNIKGIGDAAINPNPGIDNESAVGYIQIKAQIIPWIVRFNDIEF